MGYEWWTELVLLFNNINMRLQKWVVKWVKDNFDVDALELKCRQQEEKIKKLNREVVMLKRKNLPEDERRWALDTFTILTWKMFPSNSEQTEFIAKYIEQKEIWEALPLYNWEDLPF